MAKNRYMGLGIFFSLRSEQKIYSLNTTNMLRWALGFLIVAIIAAIFGFGGIAAGAASIAKILFFVFIVIFLLTLIFGGRVFGK
ncbi:DUF1328 family protein [Algoriphagus vanfongensis]|uniref:DUF1328 family protein n=1 Tax=Algoriphagus vanfongensis TaxID=426371 RepID=UPI003CCB7DB9